MIEMRIREEMFSELGIISKDSQEKKREREGRKKQGKRKVLTYNYVMECREKHWIASVDNLRWGYRVNGALSILERNWRKQTSSSQNMCDLSLSLSYFICPFSLFLFV